MPIILLLFGIIIIDLAVFAKTESTNIDQAFRFCNIFTEFFSILVCLKSLASLL